MRAFLSNRGDRRLTTKLDPYERATSPGLERVAARLALAELALIEVSVDAGRATRGTSTEHAIIAEAISAKLAEGAFDESGPEADVRISGHGSILLFQPLNDVATEWLVKHTDGTWYGDSLAVEPRYATDLAKGAQDDGLAVEFGTLLRPVGRA
jgi:hypothetical protein